MAIGGVVGFQVFNPAGSFTTPTVATWENYRKVLAHPAAILATNALAGTIQSGQWMWEQRDDAPDGAREFIQNIFNPLRSVLLQESIRGIYYGYQAAEIIFGLDDEKRVTIESLHPLLPDLSPILVGSNGELLGLQQNIKDETDSETQIPMDKLYLFTYRKEGDNYYGHGICKDAQPYTEQWGNTNRRAELYAGKTAGVIPVIMYPPGWSKGPDGVERPNFEISQNILTQLGRGRGVAIPNLFAQDAQNPMAAAQLAGKTQWVITFLETSSNFFGGFIDERKYLDACIIRTLLGLERALTEASRSASRADSETHADVGIRNAELLHEDIARAICRGATPLVDNLLEWNWGKKARGSVYLTPAPVYDAKVAAFREVLNILLQGNLATEAASFFNWDAVMDGAGFPKSSEAVIFDPQQTVSTMGQDAANGGVNPSPTDASHTLGSAIRKHAPREPEESRPDEVTTQSTDIS